jgi:3-oxoacyl-[acyl-carrier protein] reductase
MRLKNKVAIVTGGNKGIGKAIVTRLSDEGAKVAIIGRDLAASRRVAGSLRKKGRSALVVRADVSRKSDVEAMIQKVLEEFGRIDILVNNAGLAVVGPSAELEEQRWREGIDVMLNGVFFCSQAAGREMIKQKSGKIINIASINGIGAFPERACYCSAKAGVMALTKALGCEWARFNINVNAVAPGYVETDLMKHLVTAGTLDKKEIEMRTPMGRLATAEEVADSVAFLASEDAKFIEGQTIVVDGGWTAYVYTESWLEKKY